MITNELEQGLLDAVKSNNLAQIRKLVGQGADLSIRDINSDTVLHYAVKTGDLNTVQYIAQCLGARINLEDKNHAGQTPLQIAEDMNHSVIEGYLMGIRDFMSNKSNDSPNTSEITKKESSSTILEDQEPFSDLENEFAAFRALRHILGDEKEDDDEAVLDSETLNRAYTPLMLAALRGNIEDVKSLVEEGIDPGFMNQLYESARFAAFRKDFEMLTHLITQGAGTIYPSPVQDLFHIVVYQTLNDFEVDMHEPEEIIEMMDYMLAQGVKGIDSKNSMGVTPIFYAAQYDNGNCFNDRIELFEYLSEKGCSFNDKDYYGRSIMHYAIQRYAFLTDIAYLIKKGVDINSKTTKNLTSLDLATESRSIGFLCASPKTEINLENHELKKRLIKSINNEDIFSSFGKAFIEQYDSEPVALVITCFNILRSFNKLKDPTEEDEEFAQNLSKQLLTKSAGKLGYSDDWKQLKKYKDMDPKYAEIILYLAITKDLKKYCEAEELDFIKDELDDILPEVINESILPDASRISTSEDLKTKLFNVLSLRKVITDFKIENQNISNAISQLTDHIDSKMLEYNEVIKKFLEPIKNLREYKKQFENRIDHDGHEVQKFKEEKKKILHEIPGFKATYPVDLIYLKSLWEDISSLLDSYNLEREIASKESKDIKILIKEAIESLKEENHNMIQDFFNSNAKAIEQLNIEGFNSDLCQGLSLLKPLIFDNLIDHFKEDEFIEKFWGIPISVKGCSELDGKRKACQTFEDANKKAKTSLEEVSPYIPPTETISQNDLSTTMASRTQMGSLEDLDI